MLLWSVWSVILLLTTVDAAEEEDVRAGTDDMHLWMKADHKTDLLSLLSVMASL